MLNRSNFRRTAVVAAALFLPLVPAGGAPAQEWPQRPVKLILPFGPASATDLAARLISDELSLRWRQPVIVENRAGGDNLIAINAFLSAKDDHTLFFTSTAAFLAHPFVHNKLDYVFERDFAPIAKVADTILVVAVPEALGVRSVSEFVRASRANPDSINLAGATGLPEFGIDALIKTEGLKSVRVPYKDLAAAARDLAENRIQFLLTSYASVRPFVESGKIRIIAAGSRDRSPVLKDVPSLTESGYPVLAMETSVTIFGPQSMAIQVRKKIAHDVQEVLADPKIRQRIELTGQDVRPAGPDELALVLKRQFTYAASIAKELGLDPRK
jgi:tripartite-type tricarboxylate transporter receptor subunit TctC